MLNASARSGKPEGWSSPTQGVEQGPGSLNNQSCVTHSCIPFHWVTSPPAAGRALRGSRPVPWALCSLESQAGPLLPFSVSSSPAHYQKFLLLSHSCNSAIRSKWMNEHVTVGPLWSVLRVIQLGEELIASHSWSTLYRKKRVYTWLIHFVVQQQKLT